jgi:hypothetical protein
LRYDECVDRCNAVIEERSGVDPEPSENRSLFHGTGVCRLCELPTESADAILIPTRGLLCAQCVNEIQRRWVPDHVAAPDASRAPRVRRVTLARGCCRVPSQMTGS